MLSVVPAMTLGGASSSAAAAPTRGGSAVWSATSEKAKPTKNGHKRLVNPSAYKAYTLDVDALGSKLRRAPLEGTGADGVTVSVPAPNGELVDFTVVESPILEDELQAAHPDIRTYAGTSADGEQTIRFDVTPLGFHASVLGGGGSFYIDPAYVGDDSLYLSYRRGTLPKQVRKAEKETHRKVAKKAVAGQKRVAQRAGENGGDIVVQRTYRLALLSDPSYAAFWAPGLNDGSQDPASNAAVLAAKTTLINRVNQMYTQDFAVKMVMVNDTEAKLNLNNTAKSSGANGPCGAQSCFVAAGSGSTPNSSSLEWGCDVPQLLRNRHVLGLLIGADNYDIGHIVLGNDGGGIAELEAVGGQWKGEGCTGLPEPTGDYMAVDYTGHEMGHQFGSDHTFNGTQSNCASANRGAATSVEPGSGSSIMAYAGICTNDNLQNYTDPYFSQRSINVITAYIKGTNPNYNELQEVTFSTALVNGNSFTITFPGVGTTIPIVVGQSGTCTAASTSCQYNQAGVKVAVEKLMGATVTAYQLFGTSSSTGAPSGNTLNNSGFQLYWTGAKAGLDMPNPTVDVTSGTATANAFVVNKGGSSNNGGATEASTNHAPTVTAPAQKTIPIRTPFTLTGSGTDVDGDTLTYLWEQNDRGGNNGLTLTTNSKTAGPLFRVFGTYANVSDEEALEFNSTARNAAGTSPSRTFPDMAQILAGNTNAATGNCPTVTGSPLVNNIPALDCYSEFLPNASYVGASQAGNNSPIALNFRLTARDQNATAGGTQFGDTKLLLDKTAGPFLVTSLPTATTVAGGVPRTITWSVANTNTAALALNVKISLSTDGGQNFDTVLANSTPNDGSESITLPNADVEAARIKIEAVDNYFFDVNDATFSIQKSVLKQTSPSITGTPAVGSELTANPGTYDPADADIAYQWYANGVVIGGATGSTFTPTGAELGQYVTVNVTASKPGYASATASPDSVRITAGSIQNTVAPVITGTPGVGELLSVSSGTWNYEDLTFTYQWYANGAAIRGATGSTYTVSATMAGKTITAKVTASRPGNDAVSATSSNSANIPS